MTRKIYRTANGKMVDLGALQLQNENTRAVGNMNVNARGDLLDSQNRSINTRNQQVAKQYRRQTTNVTDQRVTKNNRVQPDELPAAESTPEVPKQPKIKPVDSAIAEVDPSAGGLAAAIAKARSIKQEPMVPTGINTSGTPTKI